MKTAGGVWSVATERGWLHPYQSRHPPRRRGIHAMLGRGKVATGLWISAYAEMTKTYIPPPDRCPRSDSPAGVECTPPPLAGGGWGRGHENSGRGVECAAATCAEYHRPTQHQPPALCGALGGFLSARCTLV